MKLLSEVPAGTRGEILSLEGDGRFMSRIVAMGLTVGCRVEVLQNEKKQPVLIYGRDTVIALNRKECEKIRIGGIN